MRVDPFTGVTHTQSCDKAGDAGSSPSLILASSLGSDCSDPLVASFYNCPTLCLPEADTPDSEDFCAAHLPCGLSSSAMTEEAAAACCEENLRDAARGRGGRAAVGFEPHGDGCDPGLDAELPQAAAGHCAGDQRAIRDRRRLHRRRERARRGVRGRQPGRARRAHGALRRSRLGGVHEEHRHASVRGAEAGRARAPRGGEGMGGGRRRRRRRRFSSGGCSGGRRASGAGDAVSVAALEARASPAARRRRVCRGGRSRTWAGFSSRRSTTSCPANQCFRTRDRAWGPVRSYQSRRSRAASA